MAGLLWNAYCFSEYISLPRLYLVFDILLILLSNKCYNILIGSRLVITPMLLKPTRSGSGQPLTPQLRQLPVLRSWPTPAVRAVRACCDVVTAGRRPVGLEGKVGMPPHLGVFPGAGFEKKCLQL